MGTPTKSLDGATNNTNGGQHDLANGRGIAFVAGTFDGATVTIEALAPDGATWVPVSGGSFTSPEVRTFDAVPFLDVRCVVSSAGASTSIDAWLTG